MRAFYAVFCIVLLFIFVLSYFLLGENVGIFNYYFGERLDMLITFCLALLSCTLEITRASRNTLTGSWNVEIFPEGGRDSRRHAQMKQEGSMIIYEKNRKEYLGNMHLTFISDSRIIRQGFYEIEFKRKFRKIIGTSNLKFMKELEPGVFPENETYARRRTYSLALTGRNMIHGSVQLDAQNTKSAFSATRK